MEHVFGSMWTFVCVHSPFPAVFNVGHQVPVFVHARQLRPKHRPVEVWGVVLLVALPFVGAHHGRGPRHRPPRATLVLVGKTAPLAATTDRRHPAQSGGQRRWPGQRHGSGGSFRCSLFFCFFVFLFFFSFNMFNTLVLLKVRMG